MEHRELAVPDAWELTPRKHTDARGLFLEWFTAGRFAEVTGRPFRLEQANLSVSAAGVIRGIHFTQAPPGQAKYVTCSRGAVLDVVVDIRPDSPTFGRWDTVLLDDADLRSVFLSEGLGHAFMSLADSSTVTYLCSTGYEPEREHGIHPLDPAIGIEWPDTGRDGQPLTPLLSDKDAAAPVLADVERSGLLPSRAAVADFIAGLG